MLLLMLTAALAGDPVPGTAKAPSLPLALFQPPLEAPCGPSGPPLILRGGIGAVGLGRVEHPLDRGRLAPAAVDAVRAGFLPTLRAAADQAARAVEAGCRPPGALWALIDAHPDLPWGTTAALAAIAQEAGLLPALRVQAAARVAAPTGPGPSARPGSAIIPLPEGVLVTDTPAAHRLGALPTLSCEGPCLLLQDLPAANLELAVRAGRLKGDTPAIVAPGGVSTALVARLAAHALRDDGWVTVTVPPPTLDAPRRFAASPARPRVPPVAARGEVVALPLALAGAVLVQDDARWAGTPGVAADRRPPEVLGVEAEAVARTLEALLPSLAACVTALPPYWTPPVEVLEVRLVLDDQGAVVERRSRAPETWPDPAVACLSEQLAQAHWPATPLGTVGLAAVRLVWGDIRTRRPLLDGW